MRSICPPTSSGGTTGLAAPCPSLLLPASLSSCFQKEPAAGDSPINTDIPHRVPCMLKRALTLLEEVLVSIFSWVAIRTDMMQSATCLFTPRSSHTSVHWSWGCSGCLRSITFSLLLLHLPLFSPTFQPRRRMTQRLQEPDRNTSLSPCSVNQSHGHERRLRGTGRWGNLVPAQAAPNATYCSCPFSSSFSITLSRALLTRSTIHKSKTLLTKLLTARVQVSGQIHTRNCLIGIFPAGVCVCVCFDRFESSLQQGSD